MPLKETAGEPGQFNYEREEHLPSEESLSRLGRLQLGESLLGDTKGCEFEAISLAWGYISASSSDFLALFSDLHLLVCFNLNLIYQKLC